MNSVQSPEVGCNYDLQRPRKTRGHCGSSQAAVSVLAVTDERPPARSGESRVRLAEVLRQLNALCVTTAVADQELEKAVDALSVVVDHLSAERLDDEQPRFHKDGGDGLLELERIMPLDMVIGEANPLAPPVSIRLDSHGATGVARFSHAFEGAPGWVHGAAVAAAFDMVLTGANMARGVAGPTVSLTLRYRRPTLLEEDCHFEASVEEIKGDRVRTKGRLKQAGGVTVEAAGEFINLSYEHIQARSQAGENHDTAEDGSINASRTLDG
jgi:acyl-CoA thioesterase FadM